MIDHTPDVPRSNIEPSNFSCTEQSPEATLKSEAFDSVTLPQGIENDTILGIPPEMRTDFCFKWLKNNTDTCSSDEVIFVTSMLVRDFESSLRLAADCNLKCQRPIQEFILGRNKFAN
ncbi:MAG TPA: hypothetical protein VJW20_14195 [Candidatus Angelobacter sp.]|nr:hypothetical protein [Candidatus Angelobacter sp.]